MRLLGILLVGILVGMAQTMRPFAPLFLLAFVWGLFQVTLMCWNKKNVLGCVCTVFLMLGTYLIANKVLQSVFIEIAKPQKIVVDGGNLQRTLVKGLDVSGRGRWSLETSSLLQKMNNDEVSAYLKKRVQCDRKQYWPLFVDKFVYMNDFRSAGSVIGWYQKTIKSKLPEWAVGWGEDLCALSRWLFVLGTLGFLFSGWGTCQLKFLICNCVWGVVVGFTVLMSLVEVQGRYWTIVMPFYFLMIPYMGEWFSPGHSCYVGILRFWESRRRKGGCDDDKNLVSLLLRRIYNKILKRS